MMRRGRPSSVSMLCGLACCLGWLVVGCEGMRYRVPSGSDAVLSPDGLHRVEGVRRGSLFVRPNYAFGSYAAFTLAPTVVSFKQGSRVLAEDDLETLSTSFKSVARSTIAGSGRQEVEEPGRCVALITLGLVDLDLLPPEEVPEPRGGSLRTVGSVTLVLEIRDAFTKEPLLRYGSRGPLEGRSQKLSGEALLEVFEDYAVRFQKDFEQTLSRLVQSEPPLSCEARAGA